MHPQHSKNVLDKPLALSVISGNDNHHKIVNDHKSWMQVDKFNLISNDKNKFGLIDDYSRSLEQKSGSEFSRSTKKR